MFRQRALLETIERQLDRIWTSLVVRDPGTAMAADAYEGLRKQVVAGAQARFAHLAQLAELDHALRRGAQLDDLRRMSSQWLSQSGVSVVDSYRDEAMFEGEVAATESPEVELPAYVDEATGRLIKPGRVRSVVKSEDPSVGGEAQS